jgi:hypothetical protein
MCLPPFIESKQPVEIGIRRWLAQSERFTKPERCSDCVFEEMTGNDLRNAPIAGVVLGMSSGSSWLRDSGQVAQLPLNRITPVS